MDVDSKIQPTLWSTRRVIPINFDFQTTDLALSAHDSAKIFSAALSSATAAAGLALRARCKASRSYPQPVRDGVDQVRDRELSGVGVFPMGKVRCPRVRDCPSQYLFFHPPIVSS